MNADQIEEAFRRLGIEPAGRNGDWVQARCPFAPWTHAKGTDNSPSFGVKAGPASWYNCLACKAKGKIIDLPAALAARDGRDHEELAHDFLVAEATGVVVQADTYESFEPLKALPEEVYGDLFPTMGAEAAAYLESRNVNPDVMEDMGVREWPEFRRIMFPVRGFDGALHGWTGRSYDPTAKAKVWNQKGMDKSCHILGAEHITCARPIVLVEGLMFYARLHTLGIPDEMHLDIGCIMGSSLSMEQADLLAQIGQPVILFLDEDKAGRLGTWGDPEKGKEGAVHLLSRAVQTRFVRYPTPAPSGRSRKPVDMDPDDLTDAQIEDMLVNAQVYARKRARRAG